MTIKIICCEVMKEELLSVKPEIETELEFISMGLHLHPEKLKVELQNVINRSKGYTKIILGFGLCGGAVRGLQASECELIIPKVHDCIPLLLGSKEEMEFQKRRESGTFYLSCGWMLSEKNIISDYQRITKKFGEKKASKVLSRMFDSYKRILFIHTGSSGESKPLGSAREIGRLLGLRFDETKGSKDYIYKLVNGPWDEENFISIKPQETINEELFGISCITMY